MKNQKGLSAKARLQALQAGFAPILILGLVAVATVVLVLVSKNYGFTNFSLDKEKPSSSQDNEDLRLYTNTKLGVSFNYPSSYKISSESDNSVQLLSPLDPKYPCCDLEESELKVTIEKIMSTKGGTLDKFVDFQFQGNSDIKVLAKSETKVGGLRAVVIRSQSLNTGGEGMDYFVSSGNYVYVISKQPAKTSRQAEFDQILSTLNFDGVYSGRYELCQNGVCNYLNVGTTSEGQTSIDGQAYWKGQATTNTGQISGKVLIKDSKAYFDDGSCKIDMVFSGNNLTLKERSGSSCGGLNVTFDGDYIKKN